jgi:uncharacterized lipoprotein YmbA
MRFFVVLLALPLTACATQPVSIYQASAVPSSPILAPHYNKHNTRAASSSNVTLVLWVQLAQFGFS